MPSVASRIRATLAPYALGVVAASLIAFQSLAAEGAPMEATPETMAVLAPLGAAIGETRKLQVRDAPIALPAVAFTDADGRPVSLEDFRGKIVLVNFWATFCAPCLHEMPSLDNLQAKLGGEDFQVVAINLDPAGVERPLAWLKKNAVERLAFYHDKSWASARDLGAPGMPTTLLIDRSGKEVARLTGAAEWDAAPAVEAIELLIRNASEAG